MDVVFLGTPQFAVPSLQALLNSDDFSVTGVFTQPDRRAGRGKKLCCPPVKLLADEYGIGVFQPEKIRGNEQASEIMRELAPDAAVVVAYGQILPEDFFTIPRLGTLNVHASLLPLYRGASPVLQAVLNGDSMTGVSIMKIDEGMDTGDVLSMEEASIPPEATTGYMEMVLASQGADLLVRTLREYAAGRINPVPQDHERATYAPKISKEDAVVDWNKDADAVRNQIRALNPRPGAFTTIGDDPVILKIWKARQIEDDINPEILPGTIYSTAGEGFKAACGKGTTLEILEVQLSGKGRIRARDFVNGFDVQAGDRMGV